VAIRACGNESLCGDSGLCGNDNMSENADGQMSEYCVLMSLIQSMYQHHVSILFDFCWVG
jgi:threonine dehydrogenase-like Zn-dependent dehydrogenase